VENSKSINRHSLLSRDNTKDTLLRFVVEMENISKSISALDKLYISFYNNKEVQLAAIQSRIEILQLKQKVLNTFEDGISKTVLGLNDKKTFVPGVEYEIDKDGIGFPLIQEEKVIPSEIILLRESTIKTGVISNPVTNSSISAISSISQNDLFSVHRTDSVPLKFVFNCSFSQPQIINEIIFSYISKPKQIVNLKVKDTRTGSTLFDGVADGNDFKFKKPISTKELLIEIEASATSINQLDIKELSFFRRRYKNNASLKTINMPIFNAKYLTLENVKYKNEEEKNLIDFSVIINSEKLNSLASEEKILGPYRDPAFDISFVIKDNTKLLKYLAEPLYRAIGYLPDDEDYRTFYIAATQDSIPLKQETESSTSLFLPLPLPGFESFLNVTLGGIQYERATDKELLSTSSKKYKATYTGSGYSLTFSELPVGSKAVCTINSAPSYISRDRIYVPELGLGTRAKIEYCKGIKNKKVPIIMVNASYINLRCKNIQSIYFETSTGQATTDTIEKPLGSTLSGKEYAVDYLNGLVYLGSLISGFVGVSYFETDYFEGDIEKEERSLFVPKDIRVFDFSSKITGLESKINNPKTVYGFQKHNGLNAKVISSLGAIQLPKFITLQKGSIQIYNSELSKKEVEFHDGKRELYSGESVNSFFDYISTGSNYHLYKLRGTYDQVEEIIPESTEIIRYKTDYAPPIIDGIAGSYNLEYGDYFILSNQGPSELDVYLYVQNLNFPSKPEISISAKVIKQKLDDLFSVDYSSNRIFLNSNSSLFLDGSISFRYSAIDLNTFTLAMEIAKKEMLGQQEYNAYIYNKEEMKSILAYFTPTIESLSIGFIG
jgi:hypothetical protein